MGVSTQPPVHESTDPIPCIGDIHLLSADLLAFFCSVKCPGSLILKTYDLSKELCKAEIPVIGGFHSPIEKECMIIMLRGKAPIVWCVARGIQKMRVPKELRPHVDNGRLLIVSTSSQHLLRPTKDSSVARNRFVANQAKAVFVAYADPGGHTDNLCDDLLASHRPLFTFTDPRNQHLLIKGVQSAASLCDLILVINRSLSAP